MNAEKRKSKPFPELEDIIARSPTLIGPIAYMAADIIDRMTAHRIPIIDQQRWTFDEDLFSNVAEMERQFGLLNEAPLSAEQASQERILRARRNTP